MAEREVAVGDIIRDRVTGSRARVVSLECSARWGTGSVEGRYLSGANEGQAGLWLLGEYILEDE